MILKICKIKYKYYAEVRIRIFFIFWRRLMTAHDEISAETWIKESFPGALKIEYNLYEIP